MIRKMVAMKNPEEGYEESVFGREYWLNSNTSYVGTRVEKDPTQALNYFKVITDKAGVKGSFLDIGAGAGNMVAAFRKAGYEAEGCEYSTAGREIAKERFGIILEPCDLREFLPYPTDAFNWAMCNGVLSMIPRVYMRRALEEILRVTKYGVLLNVGTVIDFDKNDPLNGNPHHITAMNSEEYWKLLYEISGIDWTSIFPPQKWGINIAVDSEFGGLWSKRPWGFQ